MLLSKLREYSQTLEDIAPAGYAKKWVRYEIHLNQNGELLTPSPIDLADAKTKQGQRRTVPQVVRTVGVKPMLLSDNAEYTLGLSRTEETPDAQAKRDERVAISHRAYLEVIQACADKTGEKAVTAVLDFLSGSPVANLQVPVDFDIGGPIVFRVDGQIVTDLSSVQSFWAEWALTTVSTKNQEPDMVCLVCGRKRPPLISLPGNIKGIPGGQSSGMALISANSQAFESYGLKRSQTSPICLECADAFTKAINALIRDQDHCYKLPGLTFIWWTRQPAALDLMGLFRDPQPEEVGSLLNAYRTGKKAAPVDETAFYGVSLSPNAARVVVRDWIDTTVGHVKGGLARWFQWQRIVDAYGEEANPLGLYALAASTVRDVNKDLPPTTPRVLLNSALTGAPLPNSLLYQAVRRCQAERTVTRPRAALIKLVLLSQLKSAKEEDMVKLQPNHPEPGYHCGRLLAVLEEIQKAAIPGINATIVDRYYGSASTAPKSVFPRLVNGAQPHLSKLRKTRRSTANALQRDLEEIMGRIEDFPSTLTLKKQAYFVLGYYHQRAQDRQDAIEHAHRRDAEKAAAQKTE